VSGYWFEVYRRTIEAMRWFPVGGSLDNRFEIVEVED
jgi:hypothetical protein